MDNNTTSLVELDTMSLRHGHYRVLFIASLGQVTGSCLATVIGIVIPLLQLIAHPSLSPIEQGLMGSISLMGIMVGDIFFGRLSDKYGYLFFFRLCPLIIFIASMCSVFFPDIAVLFICLFFMGFGVGGGYTLDSDYISEIMPKRYRQIMVGVAKASSSVGNIITAAICFILLSHFPYPHLWHWLMLIISVQALIMFVLRIRFHESPGWLIAQGRMTEAEHMAQDFLGNDVSISDLKIKRTKKNYHEITYKELFDKENIKKVIFSSIPWACEGFGVYGIGTFLPMLVMSLGIMSATATGIDHIVQSIELTTFISCFMLLGFGIGLLQVNKINHATIQWLGFLGCSLGLGLLLYNQSEDGGLWLSVAGFMIFEVFLNAGPHLMTFIIPSQIFSVDERGSGSGISAALGKGGAILGVFFIPLLLQLGGIKLVILVTLVIQLIGGAITFILGRKILPHQHRMPS